MKDDSGVITLEMMRQALYTAVVCDVLDSLGFPRQSPPVSLQPLSGDAVLIGREERPFGRKWPIRTLPRTNWNCRPSTRASPTTCSSRRPVDRPVRGSGASFIDRRAKPWLPRRDRRRVRA